MEQADRFFFQKIEEMNRFIFSLSHFGAELKTLFYAFMLLYYKIPLNNYTRSFEF